MSELAPLYPPNPPHVPKDFTEPNWSYCTRVLLVLTSLLLFVAIYVGLVVGSAYVCYSSFQALKNTATYTAAQPRNSKDRTPPRVRQPQTQAPIVVHVVLILTSGLLFLFLFKGFFKFRKNARTVEVEITEADQPTFFAFLRQLCKDTGAPLPHRVFLTPEVNAMVCYNSQLQSLFLPTPKNLVLGLGLVNHLNLSELKAVLAHEFGHFSQSSMKLGTYVYQVNRLIGDMVYGRDFFDEFIARMRGGDARLDMFASAFAGLLWVLRKTLEGLFRAINFANSALSRQMEFNADLVAVSVTGSDALVHALARIEIADQTLEHSMRDLVAAGDHKLYTRDVFVHQARSLDRLRQEKNNPGFGDLPALPDDPSATNQLFQPGDSGVPLMWATHPSNHDRERNAKRVYLRGAIDDRPAWVLFQDASSVRERVTAEFFVVEHGVPASNLSDPARVQAFIDAEHAETTYPARFLGMYTDRFLDLSELDNWVRVPPEYRDAGYLSEHHARLYGENVRAIMKQVDERNQDCEVLEDILDGKRAIAGKTFSFHGKECTAFDVEELLAGVQLELEGDHKRLVAEDRLVFQVHYAMAKDVNDLLPIELLARYRFHAGVQEILQKTATTFHEMEEVVDDLSGRRELSEEYFHETLNFFQEMHLTLKTSLDTATRLRIPKLENLEESQTLGSFLLTEPLVSYLSNSTHTLDGKWLDHLAKQTSEIVDRSRRIHFKSLGGILSLQDKIAAAWAKKNAPSDTGSGIAEPTQTPRAASPVS